MKILKKMIIELVLPLIACWFFMTVFVDIFTIPVVFRNIKSLDEAGKVGMAVFASFNRFEVFFGIMILLGAFFKFPSRKFFYFALPLFTLSLLYTFYMTPMITNLTLAINATIIGEPQFALLQSEHAKFHTLYRYFDMGKLIYLLVFFVVVIIDKLKTQKTLDAI